MPDRERSDTASVARQLSGVVIGFGLIGSSLLLTPSLGLTAFLLAPLGLLTLRGCPMCWAAELIEAASARRMQRTCVDGSCTLQSTPTPNADFAAIEPDDDGMFEFLPAHASPSPHGRVPCPDEWRKR